MDLLISRTERPANKRTAFLNPRFFLGVNAKVTRVIIDGDWPEIEAAYVAAGVPVERFGAKPQAGERQSRTADPGVDRGAVAIPAGWADLQWTGPKGELTLRGLAALLTDDPVSNKADATKAIEAELGRRADIPLEALGGLTRREIHADLAAKSIDFDPAAPPEALLALRDEARASDAE